MIKTICVTKEMWEILKDNNLIDESYQDTLRRLLGIPRKERKAKAKRTKIGRPRKYPIDELKVGEHVEIPKEGTNISRIGYSVIRQSRLGKRFMLYEADSAFVVTRII